LIRRISATAWSRRCWRAQSRGSTPWNASRGAGIYAIYYTGDFPAYAPLVAANRKQMKVPIYVGKAVPKGSRKGLLSESAVDSPTLHGRLRDHCNTIQAAANLSLGDFHCR
jgi:hypothetical protein